MHESSMDKMRLFRKKHLQGKEETPLNIVDLGSLDVVGNFTYKEIFDSPNWTYTGVDMAEGNNVDIVLKNPYAWREIKSNSVDVFISGQAFEHVEYVWILMLEVFRVLKPGGICCIIAPAGGFEHRYPVDCWRFYPDGMKALAKFSGMTTVEAYTQWEPEDYSTDNSDVWQDSVLVCSKQKAPAWSSIKRHLINRIQFKALSLDLNNIIADPNEPAEKTQHFDIENIEDFTKAIEIRDKLRKSALPSREDYEDLLEAYEQTKTAYEHTRQAYEDIKESYEKLEKSP
jgi:SAM-dependent methyltransferase